MTLNKKMSDAKKVTVNARLMTTVFTVIFIASWLQLLQESRKSCSNLLVSRGFLLVFENNALFEVLTYQLECHWLI